MLPVRNQYVYVHHCQQIGLRTWKQKWKTEAAPFAVRMSHRVLSVDVLMSNCRRVERER